MKGSDHHNDYMYESLITDCCTADITYYQYIVYVKVEPWMNITNMAIILSSSLLCFPPHR